MYLEGHVSGRPGRLATAGDVVRTYLTTCGLPPETSLASDHFLSHTEPPARACVSEPMFLIAEQTRRLESYDPSISDASDEVQLLWGHRAR